MSLTPSALSEDKSRERSPSGIKGFFGRLGTGRSRTNASVLHKLSCGAIDVWSVQSRSRSPIVPPSHGTAHINSNAQEVTEGPVRAPAVQAASTTTDVPALHQGIDNSETSLVQEASTSTRPPAPSHKKEEETPVVQTTNATIWSKAQENMQKNDEWLRFAQNFGKTGIGLSIDEVLAGFKKAKDSRNEAQWSVPLTANQLKIRTVIDRILVYADKFRDFGAAIVRYDPTQHAGLAWGLLQVFVTAAITNKDTRDLVDNHEFIARLMCRYSIFAHCYLTSSALSPKNKNLFEKDLVDLYESILKYLMLAWRYLEQNALVHALRSIVKTTVQEAFEDLRKAELAMERTHTVANAEATIGVAEYLRDLDQPLRKALAQVDQLALHMCEEEPQKILQWISDINSLDRQKEIESRRLKGTGEWFLAHPSLTAWHTSKKSSLLWLTGKMGSGKSTLMSLAIGEMHRGCKAGNRERVAFYYCDRTNRADELRDSSVIYKDLLKQLLSFREGPLPDPVLKLYKEGKYGGSLTARKSKDLILSLIDQDFATVIVIDALDECSLELRTSLVSDLIEMLNTNQGIVRILVSSRPERDLEEFFDPYLPQCRIQVENEKDIIDFIRASVEDEFIKHRLAAPFRPLQPQIVQRLTEKAQGMFRWVQMSLQALRRKGTRETLLDRLNTLPLPPELEKLYGEIYNEIEQDLSPKDFKIVRDALTLLMYHDSRVSLSTTELIEAVFNIEEMEEVLEERKTLLDFCSDFVEINNIKDEFCLAHLSVREYLEKRMEYQAAQGHALIAELCLTRLEKFFKAEADETWQFGHFVSFALAQWPHQVYNVKMNEASWRELIAVPDAIREGEDIFSQWKRRVAKKIDKLALGKREVKVKDVHDVDHADSDNQKSDEPAYDAGDLEGREAEQYGHDDEGFDDHEPYQQECENYELNDNEQQDERISELYESNVESLNDELSDAADSDDESDDDSIEWDFRREDNPRFQKLDATKSTPTNPLFAAAAWDVSEILDRASAIPNFAWEQVHVSGHPPLRIALAMKHKAIVKKLIEMGKASAVNARSISGDTTLHLALQRADEPMIRLLLENGADTNVANQEGIWPLCLALAHESATTQKLTRLLLEFGADPNVAGKDPDDPDSKSEPMLILAVKKGSFRCVEMLIDAGAKIDTQGEGNKTALQVSIEYTANHYISTLPEKLRILTFILGKGANVEAADSEGNTPLHFAVYHRQMAVMQILFDHRVNIEGKGPQGQTPLHRAASRGPPEVVRLLLEHGANTQARDDNGELPIDISFKKQKFMLKAKKESLSEEEASYDDTGNLDAVFAAESADIDGQDPATGEELAHRSASQQGSRLEPENKDVAPYDEGHKEGSADRTDKDHTDNQEALPRFDRETTIEEGEASDYNIVGDDKDIIRIFISHRRVIDFDGIIRLLRGGPSAPDVEPQHPERGEDV